MEKQEIVDALEHSITKLHEEHSGLFDRRVREEAITFHLARYMYDELGISGEDLDLDIEYNKNPDGSKDFEEGVGEEVITSLSGFDFDSEEIETAELGEDDLTSNDEREDIRPDIVVHKRGNHDANEFVAEIKKESEIGIKDAFKVLYLTHSETNYSYNYGAVVSLQAQRLFWVEDGEVEDQIEIDCTSGR